MKRCHNCGSNVEGLIGWCDCCGAALTEPEYVCLFAHDYMGSGDITDLLSDFVARLNHSGLEQICPVVSRVELITYCYPASLVEELGLKNRSRFSNKNSSLTITVVFDYERYTTMSKNEKRNYTTETVKNSILTCFGKRYPESQGALQTMISAI